MAYKDEYETARLYLDPQFERSVRETFGDDATFKYKLYPPALRAMGLKNKLSLGAWFKPALYVLRAGRQLRGTPWDVFGYAHVRRLERTLVGEFAELTARFVPTATQENIERVEGALTPETGHGFVITRLELCYRLRELFRSRQD
nr:DUF6537 domain-containing protein [Rhodococcus erythropolis]